MWLTLIEALVFVNIIHRTLHGTAKYTIPFFAKVINKYILRKKDYVYPEVKRKYQKDLDHDTMRYTFSLVFWNILTIIAVIAWPLYIVRYIFLLLFTLTLYLLGPLEVFEGQRIDEYYVKEKEHETKKDYEVRNVNLANAVINLEREVTRLKRIVGEPTTTIKKKKQHTRHYV